MNKTLNFNILTLFSSFVQSHIVQKACLFSKKEYIVQFLKIRIYILILLCFSINRLESTNYYISSSIGNDSRTTAQAQSQLTPWQSLTKLNASVSSFVAGDSILFNRGDVFYGSISINKSGTASLHIVFGAYGFGAKPIISGLTRLTNWSSKGTNLWESDCSAGGATVNSLLINHVPQQLGRYPNDTDANKGYLTFEGHVSNTQITDNQLMSSPNWTGAELVIRKNHWIMDRALITQHSGTTITYSGSSSYVPNNTWGYFIQNSPLTLNKYGEWYYNPSTKKMLLYTNSTNPSALNIDVSTIGTLLTISGTKYLDFKNLVLKGSNTLTINMANTQNINIIGCDIVSSGLNAITATTTSYITLENSTIVNTKNNALYLSYNCNNTTIRNNVISKTGIIAGGGTKGDDTYQAITIRGSNNLMEYNTIDSTGYTPIRFEEGGLTVVKNNFISNFAMTKDDGGGIYSWRGCSNSPITTVSKITNNIIINGIGVAEGTNNPNYRSVHGIYMDDNVANIEISGNTISNIPEAGIHIHNGHEISITNNTSFNNGKQFYFQYDGCTASAMRNITSNNNILFSKTASQTIIDTYTTANDVSSFGAFDYNYFCRPSNESLGIFVNFKNYTLPQWQTSFNKDKNTRITPTTMPNPETSIRFEYNATKTAKVISLIDNYIDVKNNKYSGSITLQPFTSIILLRQSITTEIDNPIAHNIDFNAFPNPINNLFVLQFDAPTLETLQVELYNMQGQKSWSEVLPIETISKQFNIEKVPNGMYLLVLKGKKLSQTKKVIVSK